MPLPGRRSVSTVEWHAVSLERLWKTYLGHVNKPQFSLFTEEYSRCGSNGLRAGAGHLQSNAIGWISVGRGCLVTGIETHSN